MAAWLRPIVPPKAKLSKAMMEVLVRLPVGTKRPKETIVARLGLPGAISATRDINAAWNETKASRDICSGMTIPANYKRLNDLVEDCDVDHIVSKLIRHCRKTKA